MEPGALPLSSVLLPDILTDLEQMPSTSRTIWPDRAAIRCWRCFWTRPRCRFVPVYRV